MSLPKLPFRLSPRLQMIASLVRPGGVLADIGADHGYLVTWLAAHGSIDKGLACDINPMPLEHSRSTIARCRMEEKVETRLSDGLKELSPGEFSQAVIAGMGGDTIADILSGVPWSGQAGIRYLLQPNSKEDHLREWLHLHGFQILEEHAVQDGNFVYPILIAEAGKMEIPEEQRRLFYTIGRIGETSAFCPAENAYLRRRRKALLLRLEGRKSAVKPDTPQELASLRTMLLHIDRRLQGMEGEHLSLIQANESQRSMAEDYLGEHHRYGEKILHGSAMLDSLPFEQWICKTAANSRPETVQSHWVQTSVFFAVRREDGKAVGMLDIRHQLNDFLRQYAGHIGYGIRPTERGKGYGSEMLRLGLKYAAYLGLEDVMLSCYSENEASRKIILKCGGRLERELLYTDGRQIQVYQIPLTI